jgi:hypothetical protein
MGVAALSAPGCASVCAVLLSPQLNAPPDSRALKCSDCSCLRALCCQSFSPHINPRRPASDPLPQPCVRTWVHVVHCGRQGLTLEQLARAASSLGLGQDGPGRAKSGVTGG